jgi:DNA-binding NarL/FixJ family response regulator
MVDTIRALVVDGNAVMRKALVQRLESIGARVVGQAASNAATLVEYAQCHPDVVTLDLGRDEESGVPLIVDLLEYQPNAVIVVYSRLDDANLIREAVAAGAAGYIRKSASRSELGECLRLALGGVRPVFDRRTMLELHADPASGDASVQAQAPHVTARQRQVLEVIATGTTSSKGIARLLFISEKTVKSHIERLSARLDVSNRSQLALRAVELGVIRMNSDSVFGERPRRSDDTGAAARLRADGAANRNAGADLLIDGSGRGTPTWVAGAPAADKGSLAKARASSKLHKAEQSVGPL